MSVMPKSLVTSPSLDLSSFVYSLCKRTVDMFGVDAVCSFHPTDNHGVFAAGGTAAGVMAWTNQRLVIEEPLSGTAMGLLKQARSCFAAVETCRGAGLRSEPVPVSISAWPEIASHGRKTFPFAHVAKEILDTAWCAGGDDRGEVYRGVSLGADGVLFATNGHCLQRTRCEALDGSGVTADGVRLDHAALAILKRAVSLIRTHECKITFRKDVEGYMFFDFEDWYLALRTQSENGSKWPFSGIKREGYRVTCEYNDLSKALRSILGKSRITAKLAKPPLMLSVQDNGFRLQVGGTMVFVQASMQKSDGASASSWLIEPAYFQHAVEANLAHGFVFGRDGLDPVKVVGMDRHSFVLPRRH